MTTKSKLPEKLVRTDNPRGFHARRLLAEQGYILIKPEIVKKFDTVEEINTVLEQYLRKSA